MHCDGLLAYEYVEETGSSELTGHAGLLPYIDLACVLGVLKEADEKIGIGGSQGWMDRQHVLSLVLLNLAGGDSVEDIRILEADEGLCQVVRQAEKYGLSKAKRAGIQARSRRGRDRTFPSETRIREYLDEFHDAKEEARKHDVEVSESELIGVLRQEAVIEALCHAIKLPLIHESQVLDSWFPKKM